MKPLLYILLAAAAGILIGCGATYFLLRDREPVGGPKFVRNPSAKVENN